MRMPFRGRQAGFTLIEITVSVIIGALLLTALYRLWSANQSETRRIGNKGDFRDKVTLATTALNRAITMAGFGTSKLDVVACGRSEATDTLTVFSNPDERRTTLRDTARAGASSILIFNDTGFTVGGMLGITDSLQQEFATIASITGDQNAGFTLTLTSPLSNRYDPGVPDIYPVERERFFIDASSHALIRRTGGSDRVLAADMTEFRVDLKDASGNPATSYKAIRVVTFSLAGTYKAPEGSFNQMRFSSTVIPRNIL